MTEEKTEEVNKSSFISSLVKGPSTKETLEKISGLVILISAVMISVGIGVGSFIQGSIAISVIGSFFVLIGIVGYIASQLLGE